jgi:hypothetical protein
LRERAADEELPIARGDRPYRSGIRVRFEGGDKSRGGIVCRAIGSIVRSVFVRDPGEIPADVQFAVEKKDRAHDTVCRDAGIPAGGMQSPPIKIRRVSVSRYSYSERGKR